MGRRGYGAGALGCLGAAALIVFVLAVNIAFVAAAVYGGYKAWVAFGDGRAVAGSLWATLSLFCGLGVLGDMFVRRPA